MTKEYLGIKMTKEYLGDSVYVDCDGFRVILTTDNGEGPSNTIYLEPTILKSLLEYFKKQGIRCH